MRECTRGGCIRLTGKKIVETIACGKKFRKDPPTPGGVSRLLYIDQKYPKFTQKPDFFSRLRRGFGYPCITKTCFLVFLKSLLFFKLYFLYFLHSPNLKTDQWIYFWIYKSATACPTWGNRFKFWKMCIFFISIKFSYSYGVWEEKMKTKLLWGKLVRYWIT